MSSYSSLTGDPRVLARSQELMFQFLEIERRAMLSYLGSGRVRTPAVVEAGAEPPVGERFVTRPAALPPLGTPAGLQPGATVIVTDDGTGVAEALSSRLQAAGHPTATIRLADAADRRGATLSASDGEEEVERVIAPIRARGAIAALVHLFPLAAAPEVASLDLAGWIERLRIETRLVFLLAKALHADLSSAAARGGAAVVGATQMGGAFATDAANGRAFFPGQGGVGGILKTLAQEWPDVRTKAVDLDPSATWAIKADQLYAELMGADGECEVGYANGQRLGLRPVAAPVQEQTAIVPSSDWVWLVTGGARGITAHICQELAERYRPTLVLLGRSAAPEGDDWPELSGVADARELKGALAARLRRERGSASIAEVERTFNAIVRGREIAANVAAFSRAGARVHYMQADVRDEAQLGAAIDQVYESLGRIDGVIHGAGVIEDKLLRDKACGSFDRVFGTKVESAFVLARRLRPESLRALVFFASVAARFGNRGQSDYAAANEVLNKLAAYLDARWPARVVAINWGPWEGSGMVNEELQGEFRRRGVRLLPATQGRQALDAEVCRGRKGDAEVIVGDGPWKGALAS